MNKGELISAISAGSGVAKNDAVKVLDMFMTTVTDALKSGDQVVLTGFGTFAISQRAPRVGRNPKTGEPVNIDAARVPKFKPGKSLKDAVQG
jgi:DNA-binding protein HU-beta